MYPQVARSCSTLSVDRKQNQYDNPSAMTETCKTYIDRVKEQPRHFSMQDKLTKDNGLKITMTLQGKEVDTFIFFTTKDRNRHEKGQGIQERIAIRAPHCVPVAMEDIQPDKPAFVEGSDNPLQQRPLAFVLRTNFGNTFYIGQYKLTITDFTHDYVNFSLSSPTRDITTRAQMYQRSDILGERQSSQEIKNLRREV